MGGMMGYSRLCFGAAYPWDAFRGQGQESQMYVLAPQKYGNFLRYAGHREGVLYRRVYFDFTTSMKNSNCIDLADIATEYGILRVDRIRRQSALSLGGWSLAGSEIQDVYKRQAVYDQIYPEYSKDLERRIHFNVKRG